MLTHTCHIRLSYPHLLHLYMLTWMSLFAYGCGSAWLPPVCGHAKVNLKWWSVSSGRVSLLPIEASSASPLSPCCVPVWSGQGSSPSGARHVPCGRGGRCSPGLRACSCCWTYSCGCWHFHRDIQSPGQSDSSGYDITPDAGQVCRVMPRGPHGCRYSLVCSSCDSESLRLCCGGGCGMRRSGGQRGQWSSSNEMRRAYHQSCYAPGISWASPGQHVHLFIRGRPGRQVHSLHSVSQQRSQAVQAGMQAHAWKHVTPIRVHQTLLNSFANQCYPHGHKDLTRGRCHL